MAGVNEVFVRSLHNEIAGHAQLDIAALHLDVGPAAQQGDVFVRRHQHVLLAGADFHALICLHLDAVVLGLQQQLTVLGDMAHVTALGEQAQLVTRVNHHFFTGGQLQVLLRDAVDVFACAYGNAAGCGGSNTRGPAQSDDGLRASARNVGLVIGALPQGVDGLGERLLRLPILGNALGNLRRTA